jgi:hypothetical protein
MRTVAGMPEAEIARRGGAIRWRTVTTPDGRTMRVAVVRRRGPRGGTTVAGPVHQTKKKG